MRLIISFLLFVIVLPCCKKGTGTNSNYWNVEYEVTSTNPNTTIAVQFINKIGDAQMYGDLLDESKYVKTPWSYEAQYTKDAGVIANKQLRIQILGINNFQSSDNFSMKIYVDGKVVIQSDDPNDYLIYMLNP